MTGLQRFISLNSVDQRSYALWIARDSRVELTMTSDPRVCVRITWDDSELRIDQRAARVLPGGIRAQFAICSEAEQPQTLKCVIRLEDG